MKSGISWGENGGVYICVGQFQIQGENNGGKNNREIEQWGKNNKGCENNGNKLE